MIPILIHDKGMLDELAKDIIFKELIVQFAIKIFNINTYTIKINLKYDW